MKRNLDANVAYVIAFLAFALSYSKLVDLAVRAGYGELMSYAWPLIVDGLAVMAARGVMRLAKSRWYAWSLLVAGTAVSIFAAVLNAMVPAGPLPPFAAALVTIVPPLCLPFASHLARKLQGAQDGAEEVRTDSDQATSHEDLAPVSDDETPPPVAADPEDDECEAPLTLVASDGAPPRPRVAKYTDAQIAQALADVAAGVSQREAGRRIGASGNAVRAWVAKAAKAA
ncbi:DUF2637 domain-containing protein [Rhodococcus sp. T2V]|uniref:DUF2637 domain-containing protein n=1 Tax=Rhodococcus sp. T2V TaxID=3034164 RepID=UPI0023E0A21E|nr:DUF2637 domain-containing protein [Rhodococcus sp. T2V]MDF3309732.1 DUF2637 domain-containing protein [Rhodococcus sp. T2V]